MTALARWCFRHRLIVAGLWAAMLIALAVPLAIFGTHYSNAFSLPGTDSSKAQALLQASAPKQAGDSDQIVIAVREGSVRDPAVRQRVSSMLAKVAALPSVTSVTSMYSPGGAAQISKNQGIAYATVTFDAPADQIPVANVTRVVDAAQAVRDPNLQVALGGAAISDAAESSTQSTEVIGMIAAGIILFVAFGSLLGMLVPLLVAIAALGAGLITVGLTSHLMTLGSIAPTVAALIGLGIGIDYALFIVTRYRAGLRAGLDAEDAAARALDTSGRAVLFAGFTVVIALLGLIVLGVGPLTGIGISAATAVLFTVIAAVTLLPALLGLFGKKLMTRRQRRALAADGPQAAHASPFWGRRANQVARHKTMFGIGAILIIAVLSIPALSLRLGSSDAGNGPKGTTARAAYDLLAQGFGPGYNGPLVLVAQPGTASDARALNALANTVRDTPGVASVTAAPATATRVDAIQVIPDSAPQDEATSTLITHLREDTIPAAEKGNTLRVYIGGATAAANDLAALLTSKLALFLGVIIGLGCLLLMIAFRSILVPLTAAVMNLFASAASFGVVVAVFQWGWGSGLLGLGKAGPVEAGLPVIMLAILFGLSVDYQVFLVSRMHEEWGRSRDNHLAIRTGQAQTGRLITAAALIMICVFMAFVFGGQRAIAEYGVGLATAVAVDAFVLRIVLVPVVMHLLGRANWWLPAWLARILPRVPIEGASPPPRVPGPTDRVLAGQGTRRYRVDPVAPAIARLAPARPEPTVLPPSPPEPQQWQTVAQHAPKSIGIAYLWWFFLGLFGAHYFYLGKRRRGLLYLCTVGVLGLGWPADAFTLPRRIRSPKDAKV